MFRHLVLRYEVSLTKYLIGRLDNEDEAAEAAQETMVRAYFTLPKLRKADRFYPWLLGIADRVAREVRRERRRRAVQLDARLIPDQACTVTGPGNEPDWDLSRAMAELPEPYKQVILMRFYGGQSCAEIGRNLGVSLGTVTSRLSRAYALLREALSIHEQDVEARS